MSSAIITLLGLYSYDSTLFDGLTLPEPLNKNIAINTILMRGGEYEVLYPNPVILKQFITSWSAQKQNVFVNWNRALEDLGIVAPLENYDRRENWSDTGENHSTSTDTTNSTGTTSGTGSTNGTDTSHGTGTVTNNTTDTSKISADDVNNFVNRTQDQSENTQSNVTDTNAATSTSSETRTTSGASAKSDTSSDVTNENVHAGRVHGNIGVTTSSTMYADWIKVVRDYGDIYDLIATLFLQDFVIPIL